MCPIASSADVEVPRVEAAAATALFARVWSVNSPLMLLLNPYTTYHETS